MELFLGADEFYGAVIQQNTAAFLATAWCFAKTSGVVVIESKQLRPDDIKQKGVLTNLLACPWIDVFHLHQHPRL